MSAAARKFNEAAKAGNPTPRILDGSLAGGGCETCKAVAAHGGGPSHNGSARCRMRASIASGGSVAHCTCAACF